MPRWRPDEAFRRQAEGPDVEWAEPNYEHARRPQWQPEDWHRTMAQQLAGYGIPEVDIARIFTISVNTLRKHLTEEMALGKAMMKAVVVHKLFEKIKQGEPWAITLYLRTQAGWIEPRDEAKNKSLDDEIEQMTDGDLQREIEAVRARARTASEARSLETRVPK